MNAASVKEKLSLYLDKTISEGDNQFVVQLVKVFSEGRLDHNQLRKLVMSQFRVRDTSSVFFGALLLQLDKSEIFDLLQSRLNAVKRDRAA
jgi:vacuolar-type H+-ATPase subunit B/Vma2